jgi:Zn-dependent peptidase ImmA (M78 family)
MPISSLIRELEKSGAIVLGLPDTLDLPKQDAFSAWTTIPSLRPMMVLAYRAHPGRLRFNVAHELGHLVMHQAPRGSLKEIEREADAFAAEFLMPAVVMHDEIEMPVTLTGLMQLRERWGVAIQALIHRAADLEMVSKREETDLYQQAQGRGWGRQDPAQGRQERPRALRQMVEMYYGKVDAVESRVATDMSWPLGLCRRILTAFVGGSGSEEIRSPHGTGRVLTLQQTPREVDGG